MCEILSQKAKKMDSYEFYPQTYSLALSFKHYIYSRCPRDFQLVMTLKS